MHIRTHTLTCVYALVHVSFRVVYKLPSLYVRSIQHFYSPRFLLQAKKIKYCTASESPWNFFYSFSLFMMWVSSHYGLGVLKKIQKYLKTNLNNLFIKYLPFDVCMYMNIVLLHPGNVRCLIQGHFSQSAMSLWKKSFW